MNRTKRPRVLTRCVADRYHAMGERIVEVTWPDGRGCLVSLRTLDDGRAVLDVYRADAGVVPRWGGLSHEDVINAATRAVQS